MTVAEYLSSVKERLLTDARVSRFSIVRERETTTDGYLRVRAVLSDESELEFAEYVQLIFQTCQTRRITFMTAQKTR